MSLTRLFWLVGARICILPISPDIDDEGNSSQLKIETVAQFVVSTESAKALCTLLNSVLSEE